MHFSSWLHNQSGFPAFFPSKLLKGENNKYKSTYFDYLHWIMRVHLPHKSPFDVDFEKHLDKSMSLAITWYMTTAELKRKKMRRTEKEIKRAEERVQASTIIPHTVREDVWAASHGRTNRLESSICDQFKENFGRNKLKARTKYLWPRTCHL